MPVIKMYWLGQIYHLYSKLVNISNLAFRRIPLQTNDLLRFFQTELNLDLPYDNRTYLKIEKIYNWDKSEYIHFNLRNCVKYNIVTFIRVEK